MHEIKINDRVTAVLTYDEDCQGPGDCMLGKIYYVKGSRYRLGTVAADAGRMFEVSTGIASGELIGLPVYAYVHSGTQLSTTPFSCSFDSGLAGFIACSREDAKGWFGKDVPEDRVLEVLRSEVEEFSKFLQGDVYIITIYVDGKEEETVGGFYGFDYAVEEAKVIAEGFVKHLEKPVLPSQIKFDEYYYIANPCIFDLYSIIPGGSMNTKSTLVFLAERGLVYRTKEEAVRHASSLVSPGIALVRQMCQDPTSLDDDADEEDPSCAFCAGTGEGQYDGQSCSYCKGKGY